MSTEKKSVSERQTKTSSNITGGGERHSYSAAFLTEETKMRKIKQLVCDIETFSSVDLKKSGVYKYAESPDFEILLFGYSVDGGDVQVIDFTAGETLPREIIDALTDGNVQKWAFNANFERVCLSRHLSDMGISPDPFADNHHSADILGSARYLNPESWRCSMIWSAYMGMPLSLEGAGAVLGLEKQKLTEGKDLIRYFCKPCNPTIANGKRTRNLPKHAPDKWDSFRAYNIRDVETEMSIQAKLAKFPVPDEVWDEYTLDQEINDRGVQLDMTLVKNAITADAISRAELLQKMQELTELDNPNSVAQMKQWLADNGMETDTLGKKVVAELLKDAPPLLGDVLSLRQSLAKSSVKKYTAMENAACSDSRARGMFQFYGANRTGRWAGRLIQMQNLPQNHLPDIEQARALVRSSNFAALELLYDSVPEVLSELIRTAFIPKDGNKLIIADFSAIEARVIAWFAGESWRNEVFAGHGRIYEASASQMFNVPIEEITKGSPLRQKGKIAELALGYGGSVGALKAMGALDMGLYEDELQSLVNAWRSANPNIVRFWWAVDRAAMTAVKDRTVTETHGIRFSYQSGMLFITLPSGRRLAYVKPRIGENQFGSPCVTYEGVGGTKKWERLDTYGPKLVENIVQATSRDILSYAMRTLRHCAIVMHVHDEIVIEADRRLSTEVLCQQMSRTPPWAKGLLLRADGFETEFYKKD
jgi:DNA polymerase